MLIDATCLRNIRIEKGYSQEKLAVLTGVNRRTIQRAESGGAVSLETLEFLAEALDVDKTDICAETTENLVSASSPNSNSSKCRSCEAENETKADNCQNCGIEFPDEVWNKIQNNNRRKDKLEQLMEKAWVWISNLIIALVLVFTKPDYIELEQKISAEIRSTIQANSRVAESDDWGSLLLKLGCTADIDQCIRIFRSSMIVDSTDILLVKLGSIKSKDSSDKPPRMCIGALKNWWCE